MAKNEGVSIGVKVYFMIGLVSTVLMSLHVLCKSSMPTTIVGACYGLAGVVLALVYGIKGFGKNAARYYKLFMIVIFMTFQLSASTVAVNAKGVFAGLLTAINCLAAALSLSLMTSKDLGKQISMAFCWGIIGIALISAIAVMVSNPGIVLGGTGIGTIATFRACSNLFIAQIVTAMTMAKYQDKAARKTK